jgi:putative transposase
MPLHTVVSRTSAACTTARDPGRQGGKSRRQVIAVDPRDTSRRCPACGHTAKGNRPTQETFHCVRHTAHADTVGALNVLRAGLVRREATPARRPLLYEGGGVTRSAHRPTPTRADGHQARPSVTVRQRGLAAAAVGVMVGPTTPGQHGVPSLRSPDCAASAGRCVVRAAQPIEARAQSGLRVADAQYSPQSPMSSCAVPGASMRNAPGGSGDALVRTRARRRPACGRRVFAQLSTGR